MLKTLYCILGLCIIFAGPLRLQADTDKQGTPVTAASLIRDTVIITEESMGWIETKVNPEVAAEASGRIQKVYVDTGQVVKAGSPILSIDSEQQKLEQEALQSEVNRLEALIANQERILARQQKLLRKKLISQERFDNTEVKLISFQEQLEGANSRLADNRRRMAKTTVFAPVGGWIEKKFVSEGDFVKLGKPLVLLVTDQFLRIVLPFPENVAARLAVGQDVKLTSPLSRDRLIEAKINQIRPGVNIHSRAVEVIIYLENPGGWRPGGTINGVVILDRRENGILVPSRALIRRPAGEVVYQLQGNTALERVVSSGQRQGDLIEITAGLNGDERIIIDGAGFLTDKAPVQEKTSQENK